MTGFTRKLKRIALLTIFCLSSNLLASSCADKSPSPGLVNTLEMGTVRGRHFARVQTHFHSPYSFDACDSKGLEGDGNPNLECLHHIKAALCTNHLNLTFITDHVEHLAEYEFSKLVQVETGDTTVVNGSAEPIGNQLNCPDGFSAVISPGLEGRLLALGMEHHVPGTVDARKAVYGGEGAIERAQLETDTLALVGIPHTESRELQTIRDVGPSFIEIYNVHANIDPKIRKRSLGLPPFEHIAKFLNYLVDPLKELNADFFFVEFFEMNSLYLQKWNTLLSEDRHIAGVAGLDSHENVFSQKASDGERLDSHRRMTRFMSNLVLTGANDIASIKSSIQAGRVYFALEGLATPTGMDIYGTVGATTVEMGLDAPPTVGVQTSSVVATVPTVIPSSIFMDHNQEPIIEGELHYIDATGTETVIATAGAGQQIVYSNPATGYYRLHVYMRPLHLFRVIFSKKASVTRYPWVISNPVRVVR